MIGKLFKVYYKHRIIIFVRKLKSVNFVLSFLFFLALCGTLLSILWVAIQIFNPWFRCKSVLTIVCIIQGVFQLLSMLIIFQENFLTSQLKIPEVLVSMQYAFKKNMREMLGK